MTKHRSTFTARLQSMSQEAAMELVDAAEIEKIKAEGVKSPLIKVFSIGHEGSANSMAVTPGGKAKITMQYLKEAVKKVYDNIKLGVKAFNRHAATNAHLGREVIGKVVGRGLKEIDGVTHALAAIHIHPRHTETPLDVASFEADCTYEVDGEDNVRLVDIDQITGIALSSSDVDSPAFAGATLRAVFQCFADTLTPERSAKMSNLTLQQVRDAIAEGEFSAGQVFGLDNLLEDDRVKAEMARVEKSNQTAYESKKTYAERAEAREIDALGKLKVAQEKIGALNRANLTQRAGDSLTKVTTDRKLSEKEAAFCKHNLPMFASEAEDEAGLKKDITVYVDDQLKEYEKVKTFFVDVEKGQEKGGEKGNEDDASLQKTEKEEDPHKGLVLTNPKDNDLIPQAG